MRKRLTGYAILACISNAAFAADTVIPLEASTPWNIHGTEDGCSLRRAFGPADSLTLLELNRFEPGSQFQLVLRGPDLRKINTNTRLSILFGDQLIFGPAYTPDFFIGTTATEDGTPPIPTVFTGNLLLRQPSDDLKPVPITPAMEDAANKLTLRWHSRELVLNTGPMAKVFEALRSCTEKLVESWGFDPAVQAKLTRPLEPAGEPQSWFRDSDYPVNMQREAKQGLVMFRLLVDETGTPSDCSILKSYNDEKFNVRTCAILRKNARFIPALNSTGEPVKSYFVDTVKWQMP